MRPEYRTLGINGLTLWSRVTCMQAIAERLLWPGYLYAHNGRLGACRLALYSCIPFSLCLQGVRAASLDSRNFRQCFSAVLSIVCVCVCCVVLCCVVCVVYVCVCMCLCVCVCSVSVCVCVSVCVSVCVCVCVVCVV